MVALDFFRAVLPDEGIYYLALINRKISGVSHKSYTSVEALAEGAALYDQDDRFQVYHACASFKESFIQIDGKRQYRTHNNWNKAKSFWIDLDCGDKKAAKGEGYLTKEIAIRDIKRFCIKYDFPEPMIVDSGNGIHCYWPLTKSIEPNTWKALANTFKSVLAADGVLADPTCTADFSRILRPVGTHNKKSESKEVLLISETQPITPEIFTEDLKAIIHKLNTPLTPTYTSTQNINDDLIIHSEQNIPVYAQEIAKHCPQVALMRDTQGDVSYEQWRGVIGIIKFSEEGVELAHEWSARRAETGHTQNDVDVRYNTWNAGPTTCEFFAKCNPHGCNSCVHKGHIQTPLVLGRSSAPQLPAANETKDIKTTPLFLPDKSPTGKAQSTTANIQAVLKYEGIIARYNQMTKQSEIIVPGINSVPDEYENSNLTAALDVLTKHAVPIARAPEQISAIAAGNPYCPVRQMIESKHWDGKPRLESFLAQIETPHHQEALAYFRKWLIQAIAAVYLLEGLSAAGMLVLAGPQGIGKTLILRLLSSVVENGFLEGATLDPSNKDSVMTIVSHWITELGELDATFKKSDLAQLKAFITKKTDKFRRPYAKKDSEFPRRTVMAGTVNNSEFLHDSTGNRRFWVVQVHSIQIDHELDIQQLWAEAKTWYDAGETWHFNQQEQLSLNEHNSQFEVVDPIVEKIQMKFDFSSFTQSSWVTATRIAEICGIDRPGKSELTRVSSTVKALNGNQFKRVRGARLLLVPGVHV